MNFQLLCLPSLTLGIASLLFLQFLCGFGELYARQSAVGCCAVSLLTVTPTPWRGGWALPGREGAFSWLCPLVWVGSRQQCSLQAVSGSSPGWRELGSLMARAVLAVLPSVIKGRGCRTSPLDPQSESLDLSRSRALQLRAEVSPWEGVVPDRERWVVLHSALPSRALWGPLRHRASGGCNHFIWRLGEVF